MRVRSRLISRKSLSGCPFLRKGLRLYALCLLVIESWWRFQKSVHAVCLLTLCFTPSQENCTGQSYCFATRIAVLNTEFIPPYSLSLMPFISAVVFTNSHRSFVIDYEYGHCCRTRTCYPRLRTTLLYPDELSSGGVSNLPRQKIIARTS